MHTYVAFQLGINVGKRQVKMAILKELLEKASYKNVKTILASGNVVFDSPETDIQKVTAKLNGLMLEKFTFEIKNIVKRMEDIDELVTKEPFKHISITPKTRLYVTFLSEKKEPAFSIPYVSPEKDFQVLAIIDGMVLSVLELSENHGTVDVMSFLVKAFGKTITTRNWNTILRIVMA